MSLLNEFSQGLLHVLYPRLCEGCRTPLLKAEEVLCLSCMIHLPRTDYHAVADNAAAVRFAGRVPYRHVTALSVFTKDSLLQHLLHRMKYANRKEIGVFFGRQLGRELLKSDWLQSVDLAIPVPLHPKKQAMRSYNQSALICDGLSAVTGLETGSNWLARTRFTDSQTQKSREERVANMKDAFEARQTAQLRGKHVLLIDDVLTTGATLEAAANALRHVTGLSVSIATIGLALD